MFNRRTFLQLSATTAASVIAAPYIARAAAWPSKPITVVVGYSAGGGTDTVIRTLTNAMQKATGWQIDVINKPGAVGGIATNYVLQRPADGYTWFGISNYNKFVPIMGHADTQAWRDFQFYKATNALASWSVRPDSPFKSFDDVVAAAKKEPGKLSISTSGTGGIWHELALVVAQQAGIELAFTPYKGGKPATLAVLQGEVDIGGGGVHEHIDLIRDGQLRNLMQTSDKDLTPKGAPKLPSVGNFLPDSKPLLPLSATTNLALKRDTPLQALKEIETAFTKAVNSDEFKAMAASKYFELDIKTGAEADKQAALAEAVTAQTFWKAKDQIGQKMRSPEELGLPDPKDFDTWWPPEGYEPRI